MEVKMFDQLKGVAMEVKMLDQLKGVAMEDVCCGYRLSLGTDGLEAAGLGGNHPPLSVTFSSTWSQSKAQGCLHRY